MIKTAVALALMVAFFHGPAEARERYYRAGTPLVHVNSYLRSNGTFVRSYWRASPGYGSHRPTSRRESFFRTPSASGLAPVSFVPYRADRPDVFDHTYWSQEAREPDENGDTPTYCRTGHISGSGVGVCELN